MYSLLKQNLHDLENLESSRQNRNSSYNFLKSRPSSIHLKAKKHQVVNSALSTKSSVGYESETILKPLQSPKLKQVSSIHKIVKKKPLGYLSPRNVRLGVEKEK